jgi:hypothetical protein
VLSPRVLEFFNIYIYIYIKSRSYYAIFSRFVDHIRLENLKGCGYKYRSLAIYSRLPFLAVLLSQSDMLYLSIKVVFISNNVL